MKKLFLIVASVLLSNFAFSQDLASVSNSSIDNSSSEVNNFIYYRPQNVFENPKLFLDTFSSQTIPIEFYTEEDIVLQKKLNSKEEGIVVFSEGNQSFYERRLDKEDITPYTWKWVHLQIKEDDGSYTNIHLRRPNWWFVEKKATTVGDNVHINIPQIGLDKEVSIVKIYPNQLDTRLWDLQKNGNHIVRPITGKVEHYVNNVVKIYFQEDDKPISVTKNHLLWSQDRNDWVKVQDLKLGEHLKTKEQVVTLVDRQPLEGWYVVYDLEVYRDHNFLVGTQNILAHNGCEIKWKSRRTQVEGDTGLKDHAKRHGGLSVEQYLKKGVKNVKEGIEVKGGRKDARYFLRKIGDDKYSLTITDKNKQILSIDTWDKGKGYMTGEELLEKLNGKKKVVNGQVTKSQGLNLTKEAKKKLGL